MGVAVYFTDSLHLKMDIQAQWWLILLGVIFGVMIILAVLYFTKTECQQRGKMVLDSKEMIGEEKTSVRVPGNRGSTDTMWTENEVSSIQSEIFRLQSNNEELEKSKAEIESRLSELECQMSKSSSTFESANIDSTTMSGALDNTFWNTELPEGEEASHADIPKGEGASHADIPEGEIEGSKPVTKTTEEVIYAEVIKTQEVETVTVL